MTGTQPRQRGAILPIVVVAMFSLLAISGLAMDFGHVYVGRSSLQNGLDAAALSAAKSVNNGMSTDEASSDGSTTFNQHLNGVLVDQTLVPTFEYSQTLVPFVAGAVQPDARYVRASINNLTIPTTLLRVVPGIGDALVLGSTAVAGPIPVGNADEGETCDLVPLMACGDPDAGCDEDSCFGYDVVDGKSPDDTTITLKTGSQNNNDWQVGPGNFQLVELECGPGGDCVRQELAGSGTGCFDNSEGFIQTKPGNTVGPTAQGFNTRFGQYQGPVSSAEYPPDVITGSMPYHRYLADLDSRLLNHEPRPDGPGVPGRRILAVQIGNCTGTTNGSGTVERLGIGCFFMTEPATHQGNTQEIVGQFVADCQAEGAIAPNPGSGPSTTTFKIVLYKDPDTNDT